MLYWHDMYRHDSMWREKSRLCLIDLVVNGSFLNNKQHHLRVSGLRIVLALRDIAAFTYSRSDCNRD